MKYKNYLDHLLGSEGEVAFPATILDFGRF
jgi:hypothetical protein